MEHVAVIDYGMGNLRSVHKALQHVAGSSRRIVVTNDGETIRGAERIVFPGQGAIGDAMVEIDRLGLRSVLLEVMRERPFLGICLGLQALMELSEESVETTPLGVFPGTVVKFEPTRNDTEQRLKVPHIGWNTVDRSRGHPLWHGIDDHAHFYFVHSYYVVPENPRHIAATTCHGVTFASALDENNLFAVQFHPEKSQRDGLRLLQNFLQWRPER